MGTVYEAYQESMRRRVALKVLDGGALPSDNEIARFEREAWIGGRLNHPNIVKVYGQGSVGSVHYIAMELVDGESLDAVILDMKNDVEGRQVRVSNWRTGPLRGIVELFVGVADALTHVHRQGIVHRDIKPGNLLLTQNRSRLLLTDFGLAREDGASLLTRRGDFLGTIRYMSPEQLLAQRVKVDFRSDIYSLGVSLYEAVTLDLPYEAQGEEAYISAVATKLALPARRRNRGVSPDLETILMKCLERDPERRYGSAEALREDLNRLLQDRPVQARRPSAALKTARFMRRHRGAISSAAAVVLVAFAVLVVALRLARERRDLRRIHWTLEQVMATGVPATAIEPEWKRLEEILRKQVDAEPGSEITRLAQRAALTGKIIVPAFGLLSSLPTVSAKLDILLDPGAPFQFLIDLEGSWDGGPWQPLGSCSGLSSAARSATYGVSLGDIFSSQQLSAAPHRLDTRGRISYLDPDALPPVRDEPPMWNCVYRLDHAEEVSWTKKGKVHPRFEETRSFGSLSINLFEEYPSNFPTRVDETEETGPLSRWFALEIVRLLCIQLPAGKGRYLAFNWLDDRLSRRGQDYLVAPVRPSASGRLIVGIELNGRMEPESPLPVASQATLLVGTRRIDDPSIVFPLAFGSGSIRVGCGASSSESKDGRTTSRIGGDLWCGENEASHSLIEAPPDGTMSGLLRLAPSRDVAISTARLDRYFGKEVTLPVLVEVVSTPAKWVDRVPGRNPVP